MRVLGVLLGLMMSVATVCRAGELELRFEADVHRTLPSIPISVRLVAINHDTVEHVLPTTIYVHALRGDQQQFLHYGGVGVPWLRRSTRHEDEPDLDATIHIAPGATISTLVDISSRCSTPPFLFDPFMSQPGIYNLRLIAANAPDLLHDAVEDYDTIEEVKAVVPNVLVSSLLELEVAAPDGVDADAWFEMRKELQGRAWPTYFGGGWRLTKRLRERYPNSAYARCFGAIIGGEETDSDADVLQVRDRLRSVSPRPAMLDWVELVIAGRLGAKCSLNLLHVPRNVEAAVQNCEKARAEFATLKASSTNRLVRDAAVEGLETTDDRDGVLRLAAALEAVDPERNRIRPFVVCSERTEDGLRVELGYENPNRFPVTIRVGDANRISPTTVAAGPPTTFAPGIHLDAIAIELDAKKREAPAVSWTLDGVTISAPSSSDPKCEK